ncbi:MAG: sulfotransferase [Acidimicrobiales bacterium]
MLTPENVEIGSILLSEFEDAQFVHVVRDPRAVAVSLRAADFGPSTLQQSARLWKQRVASGLALECLHPDRVTRVRYEDLLRAPTQIGPLLAAVPCDEQFHWELGRDLMLDKTSLKLQANVEHAKSIRRGSTRGARCSARARSA